MPNTLLQQVLWRANAFRETQGMDYQSTGAVPFQEASNREIERYLTPGVDFVPYTGADLERLLEQHLEDDELRERVAAGAVEDTGRWGTVYNSPTFSSQGLRRSIPG